jgi:hypothetical protein
VLSTAEFLRGLYLELQSFNFGALLEGFLNERSDVEIRLSDRDGLFEELEILLVRLTENRGERCQRNLVVVLGFQQEKFAARQIDV